VTPQSPPPADVDPTATIPPALTAPTRPARARAFVQRLAVPLALAYTVSLALAALALRFVGEAWWVTTAALYLPRIGFALPLPFVALALALARAPSRRRRLWLLAAPVALLLFPLMGLRIGPGLLLKSARAARPGLRVLSYNIQSADHARAVAKTVVGAHADLVLLQEWDYRELPHLGSLPGYHTHVDGQFGVLSRFPITEVVVPPPVPLDGVGVRAAEFIRYRIETDLGPVTVFNVHPISPRDSLVKLGGPTVLAQLRHGRLGPGPDQGIAALKTNALMRWRQAEAISGAARAVAGPVIIAGDTNLPSLSRIFAQTLAGYRDGFVEAGRGFGYTYPTDHPWMRIDRILASPPLAFQRFEVLPDPGSDHLAVAAELTIR
jgi:endonuclease/exonuclease/phosphatase (EEP) superfamily protein YafD